MDHLELKSAWLHLFGSEARAARELGIDPRGARKYTADPATTNARSAPEWVIRETRALLKMFPDGAQIADPRRALEALHAQVRRGVDTDGQAAAAILGAAIAHARRHLGEDGIANLLRGGRDV